MKVDLDKLEKMIRESKDLHAYKRKAILQGIKWVCNAIVYGGYTDALIEEEEYGRSD